MKKPWSFFLPSLVVVAIAFLPAANLSAQTFTTLHHFTGSNNPTNSDGRGPTSGVLLSNGVFYGTTASGGRFGFGAVFKMNTDGSGYTNIHSFTGENGGKTPSCGLVLSNDILYGTTFSGTTLFPQAGKVFRVKTDGSGFTNLHTFATAGGKPTAELCLVGDSLFGTTSGDLLFENGEVFKINIDGTGFQTLHSFSATVNGTNSDGSKALGGLVWSGDALFGTTSRGGAFGKGTIYRINTNGAGFTNLCSISGARNDVPTASMILHGDVLYGTAGDYDGFIFRINIDGGGFTNLHLFNFAGGGGRRPEGALLLIGDTLYGTLSSGGIFSSGALFSIKTNGADFSQFYDFTLRNSNTNSDGSFPESNLIVDGNKLYGTAYFGGSAGFGTVFSLALPPPRLRVNQSAGNLIFSWSTNQPGFFLQSTTNLIPPIIWDSNLPAPVVVNGQNTVTNPIAGTQQFFRLSQ